MVEKKVLEVYWDSRKGEATFAAYSLPNDSIQRRHLKQEIALAIKNLETKGWCLQEPAKSSKKRESV